jgi:hypothetical protein
MLLRKTETFAHSEAGMRGDFTPHPATWFNRSSYLDDETEWGVRKKSPEMSVELTDEEKQWAQDWNAKERARIAKSGQTN